MRRLAVVSLLLAACAVQAQDEPQDMVYTSGRVQIRLLQADCDNAALATALAEGGALTPPKAATVKLGAYSIQACWALDADTDVLVGDENGSRAYFPVSAFRPAPADRRNWV